MRKRKKFKMLFILAAAAVCIVLAGKQRKGETYVFSESEEVYAQELAGYLMIIPLTPEETRSLIIPELNEMLTGKDIEILFQRLGLGNFYGEAAAQASLEDNRALTRAQWTIVYELMLDKLGVREQVTELKIQYLGTVSGEERIIADSGNYDCDLAGSRFSYGKVYTVYLYGNTILGRKDAIEAAENQADDSLEQPEAEDNVQESARAEVPSSVRVLLTQDNGCLIYRENVWLKGSAGLTIASGEQSVNSGSGEVVSCADIMNTWNTDTLTVQPSEGGRLYLTNAQGSPDSSAYRGDFQIYRDEMGYRVVNRVSMEEYLYGVAPGEMPESFAPEAQKAQAVCARTYAARQAANKSYDAYGADVDDTTDCQVYLPSKENPSAIDAVDSTKGQILMCDGEFAQIYYFSTSCGYTSGLEVWGQEPVSYLKKVSLLTENSWKWKFESFIKDRTVSAYDSHSRYFRWTAKISLSDKSEALRSVLQQCADNTEGRLTIQNAAGNTVSDCSGLGACKKAAVGARSKSGMATDLCLEFENGSVHIYNENTIRTVLGAAVVSLEDKNGNSVNDMTMLPSAAFVIEEAEEGDYDVYGGGLGHGIGMSQYGADGMANAGISYTEILDKFFPGTELSEK